MSSTDQRARLTLARAYPTLLGREPSEPALEVGLHRGLGATVRHLVESEEHARFAGDPSRKGRATLAGGRIAEDLLPVGTRSSTTAEIIGRDGMLLLFSGSNAVARQFAGELLLSDRDLDAWSEVIEAPLGGAAELDAGSAFLVVPG